MPDSPDKAFLGRGWAFPVSLEAGGQVSLAEYEEDIRQSIRLILETNPGERVMRPDFGAGLHALAFEPLNTTTLALARPASSAP
jgi:phage baseplate assembly protein W